MAKATLSRTCVTVQRIHLYFLIDRELLIGGSASSFRKTYSSAVRRVNLMSVTKAEYIPLGSRCQRGLLRAAEHLCARERQRAHI